MTNRRVALVLALLLAAPVIVRGGVPSDEPAMARYVLGLIRRGPAWTDADTPDVRQLQKGHMANMERLAAEGKLIAAGPMEDDATFVGIFLFDVDDVKQAEALAATDPAVRAGRLQVEFHRWWARGYLPRVLAAAEAELKTRDDTRAAALPEGFKALDPALATGGAPSAEALRKMRVAGWRTILNLRMPDEPGVAEEEALARELGFDYVSLPLTSATLDPKKLDAFLAVVNSPMKRPLVVHCASSNRVGMMFALKAATADHLPLDEAEKRGEAAGLTSDDARAAFRRVAKELAAK